MVAGGACVVAGGVCVVAPRGGMHGCCQGGMAWLLWGVCVVAPGGMCGCSGGACMVALGGGHVWLLLGGAWDMTRYGDTINERAVHILLECILVLKTFL